MKTYNRFGKYPMVGRDDGVDIKSVFVFIKRRLKLFFNKEICPDCGFAKDTGKDILLCNKCFNDIYQKLNYLHNADGK